MLKTRLLNGVSLDLNYDQNSEPICRNLDVDITIFKNLIFPKNKAFDNFINEP